jgi:hypothetical protein
VRWTVAAGAGGMAAIWAGGIGRVARREDRREGGSGARQNAENKRCASLSLALLPDKGGGEERERLVTGAACDNACLFVCLHPPD